MAEDFSVGIGVELDGDVDIQKKLNELSKNKNFHIDVKTLRLSDNAEKTLIENIKGIRGLGVQIDEVQISKTAISKLQNELAKNKIPLMIDMPSVDGKLRAGLTKFGQTSGNVVSQAFQDSIKNITGGIGKDIMPVVSKATQEAEAQINKFVRDIESKSGKISNINITSRARTVPGDEEAGVLPSTVLEADRAVIKYTTDLGESKTVIYEWRQVVGETGDEVKYVWEQVEEHISKNLDAVEKATQKAIQKQAKFQTAVSDLRSDLESSEKTWRSNGLLVGEFAERVGDIKTRLESINSFKDFAKLEADFHELADEGNKASRSIESSIRNINKDTQGGDSSKLEARIAKITDAYKKVQDVGVIASRNFFVEPAQFDRLAQKYETINELKHDFENAKTENEQVQAYRNLADVLQQVENELDGVKRAQTNVLKENKLERQSEILKKKYISDINAYTSSNTRMTKEMRNEFFALKDRIEDASLVTSEFSKEIGMLRNKVKAAGLEGRSFFDEMRNSARKVANWLGATTIVMTTIHKVREAIGEIKELDNILTEISKTSDLTNHQLEQLGKNAYGAASQFGKKASDYLVGVQEMYRAGYQNAEDMAKLSVLAQAAGDMSTDVANDYLIATDAAYHYKGNVEQLNAVLDGMNYITNHNALSMNDLASAMKIAASQSASVGVGVDEAAAAMGTMIATTRQSGDTAARAWRGILMNVQQVKGKGIWIPYTYTTAPYVQKCA